MRPKNKDWIFVSTGERFWPTKPKEEDVDIEWIAHSLAHLCRFCGHTKRFYSVAQHSVLVSTLPITTDFILQLRDVPDLGRKTVLAKLFHDSPETVISDIARPVKYIPNFAKVYLPIENKIQRCVYRKLGIPWLKVINDEVKRCDDILCFWEIRDLIRGHSNYFQIPVDISLPRTKIKPVGSKAAKQMFLKRYDEILNNYI